MNKELNIGDYVRILTLSGISKIAKLEKIDDICITDNGAVDRNNIIKSSPNIIDLIEVGDFVNYEQVNGGYVLNKKEDSIDTWAILPNSLKNEDIKSIITREQMKSLEYKIGE